VFATKVIKMISSKIQSNFDYTATSNLWLYLLELPNKTGIKVTEECSIKYHCRWELCMFSSKTFMCLQSNVWTSRHFSSQLLQV